MLNLRHPILKNLKLIVLKKIITPEWRSASNSEKVLLLALAPKSWGRRRLAKEFGASERQTRKAKKLVAENGI